MVRALLSLVVVLGVTGLVKGGVTSEALAITHRSHHGSTTQATSQAVVFGAVTDRAGRALPGFTVTASHREGRRQVKDGNTVTGADGTYRLSLTLDRSAHQINRHGEHSGPGRRSRTGQNSRSRAAKPPTEIVTITGPRGRPTARVRLQVREGDTYQLDATVVHSVRLWVFPVFAY